jgi:hypothetical protein
MVRMSHYSNFLEYRMARSRIVRWNPVKFGGACLIGVYISVSTVRADTAPEIPASVRTALKCIYLLLKSNSQFQSVDVYSVDDFRSALEFTIRGKDGHDLTSDILLSGPFGGATTWSLVTLHGETTAQGFEELDSLTKSFPGWDSSCNLKPAADNLLPQPKPRSEWRRLSLGI